MTNGNSSPRAVAGRHVYLGCLGSCFVHSPVFAAPAAAIVGGGNPTSVKGRDSAALASLSWLTSSHFHSVPLVMKLSRSRSAYGVRVAKADHFPAEMFLGDFCVRTASNS
jgi:hypothetical protein